MYSLSLESEVQIPILPHLLYWKKKIFWLYYFIVIIDHKMLVLNISYLCYRFICLFLICNSLSYERPSLAHTFFSFLLDLG